LREGSLGQRELFAQERSSYFTLAPLERRAIFLKLLQLPIAQGPPAQGHLASSPSPTAWLWPACWESIPQRRPAADFQPGSAGHALVDKPADGGGQMLVVHLEDEPWSGFDLSLIHI